MALLKHTEIRRIAKAAGKRIGKDFLSQFEHQVTVKLKACIEAHNAGKATLDSSVAILVFGAK